MKNKLYDGQKLNDFKELVSLYKNKYKDNLAFEYKETPDSTEYIEISYSKFAQDIENLGVSLLNLNCKRVALISSNRYEWFVSYLAVTTAGLTIVPLDKSLPSNEIINLIERSSCDTIIYSSHYEQDIKKYKSNVYDLDDEVSSLTSFNKRSQLKSICMDSTYFSDLLVDGSNASHQIYDNIKIDNKSMSIMLFTSGTTSASKAVMLSQYAICMEMYALSQMIDINTSDKFLSFLPLHHTFESTCTFLFGTSCGISIAICDGLKYIQKNLVEYHITGFVCVPLMLEIMYKKMLKTIEKQNKTALVNIMKVLFRHAPICIKRKVFKSIIDGLGGKLKTIIAGGAPMDKDTLQGYNDFGFDIHQGYGLTETSPVLAGENSFNKRVGSVGFPLPTIVLKIDNPDESGIGEIIAKTPAVMLGYYQNESATNDVLIDGWFHTGDLGYIDKDGFVFITGRKKDMIVLKNGKKIFPEELEALINKLPYVLESMVFGHLDTTKNDRNEDVVLYAKIVYNKEEITKILVNDSPASSKNSVADTTLNSIMNTSSINSKYYNLILSDIKNKINKQMPAYKYIRDIIITDEPLIKTTTQKIKRNEEIKKISDSKLKY